MSQVAKGPFDVTLTPLPTKGGSLSLMSIAKQYHGALEAAGQGQMLAGSVEQNGSRAYVALETVTGRLDGRVGSFLLAHQGAMTPKSQSLSVIVVPSSGTGELAGLSGEMTIDIADGKHSYALTYAL